MRLEDGLSQLGIVSSETQRAALHRYLSLLANWNQVHNLVAPQSLDDAVSRHLLDALSVSPWLPAGGTVLDVGSGAGLPVLPLAVIHPHLHFVSVETIAKKCRFQRQGVLELSLANVNVIQARIEKLPAVGADAVISRAFTAPERFLQLAAPHASSGARAMVMLGRRDTLPDTAPSGWRFAETLPLLVPGLDAERRLALYWRDHAL